MGDSRIAELHLWHTPPATDGDHGHTVLSVSGPLGEGTTPLRLTGDARVRWVHRTTGGGLMHVCDEVVLTVTFRAGTPPPDAGRHHAPLRPATPSHA